MKTLEIKEVGVITQIRKSIALVEGLSSCMNGQLLDITTHAKGLVIGFDHGQTCVVLLGKAEEVRVGTKVFSSMQPFHVPVGENFLSRIVNALAEPMDDKGPINSDQEYPVFRQAPGILDRDPINEAFQTGIFIIDTAIPIGKGQRELIIGDRMTGKSNICVDAILNQKGKDIICIYCFIGRAFSLLEKMVTTLKVNGALDYTVVVSATAASTSGEQYLAPYTASALGEYFMYQGKDVFVVFDDLTRHAWAYRQLSLLLERSPGRDAYPGDIFYLHSQLMERAANLNQERSSGSMTFFPIVDTIQGDFTGYLPSNLISMTDGQIYLNTALFSEGIKPAIDLGLSVSRIGNKVQSPLLKKLSMMLRLEYVQYQELLKTMRFQTTVSPEVEIQLKQGKVLMTFLKQEKQELYSDLEQILFLVALRNRLLMNLSQEEIFSFKQEIKKFVCDKYPDFAKEIMSFQKPYEEICLRIVEILKEYLEEKGQS